MRSRIGFWVATSMLVAGLAFAEPQVEVQYHDGVPQIILIGDFSRTRYTIYRADASNGDFAAITSYEVLCLGSCFTDDYDATPGKTYWYRFDIVPESGGAQRFGPYPVTISPTLARRLEATVSPNPSRGPARIDLFMGGSPTQPALDVDVTVLDLQGRRVHTLLRGALGRGRTTLNWDGRDETGRRLAAGQYFVRFATPMGTRITRLIRAF